MRLLTATAHTQGRRANDFHWCVEGELVIYQLPVCARDAADPDGGCGCGRSFAGLASHRATTTAMVRDLPDVTRDWLTEAIASSLDEQGWPTEPAADVATDLITLAAGYETGTVLERRLDRVTVRPAPPPPAP